MPGRKIVLSLLIMLFTAPAAFCQSEALKGVVNNLAFYRQRKDLKYLANAKKQVDSLIKNKADSASLSKNVFKVVVYSSILYTDSLNKLKLPATTLQQITDMVDAISKKQRVFKYQVEMSFSKRCLSNVYLRDGAKSIQTEKYHDALIDFQKAADYTPAYKRINAYIGYTNAKLGKYPEAAKAYGLLLNTDTLKTEDVIAAASAYKALHDTSRALQVIQKARKILTGDRVLLFAEANILNQKKDYKGLEPLLDELIDSNSKNVEVAFMAANCYDHLNDYDRAESMYLETIELNNRNYDAIFNLGLLYFKNYTRKPADKKNIDRAILWFEKANTILPNNLPCLQLLQLAYVKTRNENQLNKINDKLKQLTN